MDVQNSHFQKAPSSIFVMFLGILMLVIDEFEKAKKGEIEEIEAPVEA